MRDEKRVVTLNGFEQRLMVAGLTDFRNDALRDGKPTEDVDDLILLPNKNIGNLVEQKESGDPIRRML